MLFFTYFQLESQIKNNKICIWCYRHKHTFIMIVWLPIMNYRGVLHLYLHFYSAEIFWYTPWRTKGFSQFEIMINVSVGSFTASHEYRFLWWRVWVYCHYKYCILFSGKSDFRRQNRFVRIDDILLIFSHFKLVFSYVVNILWECFQN